MENMCCVFQDAQLTHLNAMMDTAFSGVKSATTLITAWISSTRQTAHIHHVNILSCSLVALVIAV